MNLRLISLIALNLELSALMSSRLLFTFSSFSNASLFSDMSKGNNLTVSSNKNPPPVKAAVYGLFCIFIVFATAKLRFKACKHIENIIKLICTTAVTLESGKVYKYSLTMNSTGLTVSQVAVTPWGDEQSLGSDVAELYVDLWATARQTDGVYAIKADGRPVAFAEANDESYAGVAFVANGRVYQVAKQDAIQAENSGNMNLVYWDKNGVSSCIEGLDNLNMLDNENDNLFGLLPYITTWKISS